MIFFRATSGMGLRYCAGMKQLGLGRILVAIVLGCAWIGGARAQTSLDELQKDLDQVKQEHQDATTQTLATFLNALQNAAARPDAAVQLYQQAGGDMPAPTQVTTRYEHETPTEKAQRLAQDQANVSALGGMLQLQCGLMRFAALFMEQSPPATLHDDWTTWLKSVAPAYPQLAGADSIRNMTMKESPISAYLNFHGWGDKEQGGWTVRKLPAFYRQYILDPLRNPIVADVLPAWDTYIAMRSANAANNPDKWNNEDLPELQFERTCDDFALQADTDKLQTLVQLIKDHPTHPKVDEWISTTHDMIAAYKAQHEPGSTTNAPTTNAPADTSTNAPASATTNAPATNAPASAH
jgi:hypothetical protein